MADKVIEAVLGPSQMTPQHSSGSQLLDTKIWPLPHRLWGPSLPSPTVHFSPSLSPSHSPSASMILWPSEQPRGSLWCFSCIPFTWQTPTQSSKPSSPPPGKKWVSESERGAGKQGVQIGREREQEAELGRQGVGRGEERQPGKIGRKEKTERS